ncbi:uncharacterized protein Bfra_000845 [Botrytis fragariae]|uniref:Uncharacterized protein n=1 Tax=Botrytis fragariae TaxID=1964551 RepID=A0A8H6B3A1_9HELO|nr:uncharacterized protein Bfra_000845 [Botrytis fragariae]KAF5878678.1 hypothetical protein Bfra_000845 [Botrytis fragariae]
MSSTGSIIPTTDLTDDITAIRNIAQKEIDAGKEIIRWTINTNCDYQNGFIPAINARHKYYHDLNDTMARDYESKLKLQSVASFQIEATLAAYLVIPSVYLICGDELEIPKSLQEFMIAEARTSGGVMNGEQVFCEHNPFFKEPGTYS